MKPGARPQPAISSKLAQMKFMNRGTPQLSTTPQSKPKQSNFVTFGTHSSDESSSDEETNQMQQQAVQLSRFTQNAAMSRRTFGGVSAAEQQPLFKVTAAAQP